MTTVWAVFWADESVFESVPVAAQTRGRAKMLGLGELDGERGDWLLLRARKVGETDAAEGPIGAHDAEEYGWIPCEHCLGLP